MEKRKSFKSNFNLKFYGQIYQKVARALRAFVSRRMILSISKNSLVLSFYIGFF